MFYDAKCKKKSPNNILDSGPVTKLVLIKTFSFATTRKMHTEAVNGSDRVLDQYISLRISEIAIYRT